MIDRSALFDADTYYRSGQIPWSFLAWPSAIDDTDGLPEDEELLHFLALLQRRGIELGVWQLPPEIGWPHTWGVVRREHVPVLMQTLQALQAENVISSTYLSDLSDRLMKLDAQ